MRSIRCLNVIAGMFVLFGCIPTSSATQVSPSLDANPPAGAVMRWTDGSQVIAVDMDPTEGQVWVSQTDISHHMYSLCVEAGQCKEADHDVQGEHDPNSPVIEPYVSVQDAQAYCEWAGGRLATEDEIVRATGIATGKRQHQPMKSLRCAVETPHVTAPFCQTSAMYRVNKSEHEIYIRIIKNMVAFESQGQFCQNGQGYATASVGIEGCETRSYIRSVSGDEQSTCEIVDEGKLVCYGSPGSAASGSILAGCESAVPVDLICPAGYEADPTSPASCSWSSDLLNQDCFQGIDAIPLAGGGYSCALGKYSEGGGAGGNVPPPSSTERKCMYPMCGGVYAQSMQGDLLDDQVTPLATSDTCPIGMYFDTELIACVSLGSYDDQCLAGYAYDETGQCCQSSSSDGYPGCPAGQVFDPATGMCDPNTMIIADEVLRTVEFSLDLPACGGTSGGGGGSCQLTAADCAGQELDAANCKCIPVQ